MIKAIIFDIGGVLVDVDLPRCRKAFTERIGFTMINELLDASHQRGFYSDMEEGVISADEFREKVIAASAPGATAADVDECLWQLLTGMDEYKAVLLNSLHDAGYVLYLLSNNNAISMVACHKAMADAGLDYERVFKKEFLSYRMKLLKPDRAIYERVVSEVGLQPSEIMFIDDSMSNIEAASALGIKALHYTQGSDLKALINDNLSDNRRVG